LTNSGFSANFRFEERGLSATTTINRQSRRSHVNKCKSPSGTTWRGIQGARTACLRRFGKSGFARSRFFLRAVFALRSCAAPCYIEPR
jgi:ribosomal protein L15